MFVWNEEACFAAAGFSGMYLYGAFFSLGAANCGYSIAADRTGHPSSSYSITVCLVRRVIAI
ncbi:hypothetical protein SK3146_03273 [Paenibacillus konkukensis]|uniref:Uncharacterized protein n=1 Tax=Paenibacillus konkukensis TaxID=2020716 RepID=A0ABY4RQI5_9BACL|nr:hypothetical protein SK3146_03273 [Paenibacillus konkukensis]